MSDETSPRKPNAWLRLLPVGVWLVVIFFASTGQFTPDRTKRLLKPVLNVVMPGADAERLDRANFVCRKLAHVCEYACLGALLAWTLAALLPSAAQPYWLLIAVAPVALVAASDEFHQSFVPGRTAAVHDVALDVAGSLLTLIPIALYRWRAARRTAPGGIK